MNIRNEEFGHRRHWRFSTVAPQHYVPFHSFRPICRGGEPLHNLVSSALSRPWKLRPGDQEAHSPQCISGKPTSCWIGYLLKRSSTRHIRSLRFRGCTGSIARCIYPRPSSPRVSQCNGRKAYTCGCEHRLSPLALPVTLMLRRGNGIILSSRVVTWNSRRWLIVGTGGEVWCSCPLNWPTWWCMSQHGHGHN